MSLDLALPIAMRWIHILCATTLVGGWFFFRIILLPTATGALESAEREKLFAPLFQRWKKVGPILILLFLVSGVYNLMLSLPKHEGQPLYHSLFALKFILAFTVFFLVSALSSTKKWSEGLRSKMPLWAGLTLALAVVVVLISGVLRNIPLVE